MIDMKNEVLVQKIKDEDIIKKFRKEKAWGLVVNVDLRNCNPETIRDPVRIREFIFRLCDFIDMKRFEPTFFILARTTVSQVIR